MNRISNSLAKSIRALLSRACLAMALLSTLAQSAKAWESQGHQLIVSSGTAILADSFLGQYLELNAYLTAIRK